MTRPLNFYSLLYIDTGEARKLQGKIQEGTERIELFLKNAALLDLSLKTLNPDSGGLILLINDEKTISRLLEKINYPLEVREIDFSLDVPKGIVFYSAHFKIDVFKYLGSRPEEEYSVLLDNDVVNLFSFPNVFHEIVREGNPIVYHVPISTPDHCWADCRKLETETEPVHWAGGEFIGGCSDFFANLYRTCIQYCDKYFPLTKDPLFHVGDEFLTTMALNKMRRDGLKYYDAYSFNLVKRCWGPYDFIPLPYAKPILAHLPADKVWLSKWPLDRPFDAKRFLKRYTRHWRLFRMLHAVRNVLR